MTETPESHEGKEDQDRERQVPLSALAEERRAAAELRQQVAELRGRLDGMQKPAEQKPTYTNAQLKQMVDQGKLTESQALDIREKQQTERMQQMIDSAVTNAVGTTKRTSVVNEGIERYVNAIPALNDVGSPERRKAEKEFARLRDLGLEDNQTTNLLAMQTAFGPVESLEASKETAGRGESHEETGGSGGKDTPSGSGWPKDMPKRNREHYEGQIAKGRYTKESAVAEWKKYATRRVA